LQAFLKIQIEGVNRALFLLDAENLCDTNNSSSFAVGRFVAMDKELSVDDIEVDELVDDMLPVSRVVKIIDDIEFLKDDYEEIEITLSSLGLD
jgi:hypothetical protein